MSSPAAAPARVRRRHRRHLGASFLFIAEAAALAPVALDAGAGEEIEDLQREAGRLRARLYEASDHKYQSARAMAARDLKSEYAAKVSRRPRNR